MENLVQNRMGNSFAVIGVVLILTTIGGCTRERADEAAEHRNEHEAGEEIIVRLDKHKVFHAGIKVEPVAKRSVAVPLTLPGRVSFNERKLARITARVGGRVEQVNAFENDRVRKGDVLIELYSPEFLTLQFEFIQAVQRWKRMRVGPPAGGPLPQAGPPAGGLMPQAGAEEERSSAEDLYASARRKLIVIDVSANELAELETTQTPRTYYAVRAPFGGVILETHSKAGESVQAGSDLYELADLQTLWVLADIYEKDLPQVSVGMEASVEVSVYPGSWNGVVSSVYNVVDEKTRTVKARIEVTNRDGRLKPEMFCTVRIHTQLGKETIKVPASALLGETEKHFVFVAVNDTTFEKRDVRTGAETREFAEILDGLIEGERVVVKGGFFLKSELAKETFGEEH